MAARDTQSANPRQGLEGGQGRAQEGQGQALAAGGQQHPDHTEGMVARAIEHYTAQLPSDAFLWAAAGSIGLSLALRLGGNRHDALFVGQWAPTFLILGLYNKLVKVAGSDPMHRGLSGGGSPRMAGGAGI